jgi:ABC-type proline/glycine betaine transport system ATPase subunit
MRSDNLTARGAQNKILEAHALCRISDKCTESTQRYFFGGRTNAEALAGNIRLRCDKGYVMQELGRFPSEEIPEIAEAIANNVSMAQWTQQEIVDKLKAIRMEQ